MEFSVRYDFSVNRRVPWDGDQGTLRSHIGEVHEAIGDHDAIATARAQSNLSTGRLALELTVVGKHERDADLLARQVVADAIRAAKAYHSGVMTPAEELRLRPELNAWSGLRTPTWQMRGASIEARPHRLRAAAR